MREVNGNTGLCMTCNNAPSCFHRVRRGPAQFCETFEDYVPSVVRRGVRVATSTVEAPSATGVTDDDASCYAGLCMNCRHQRSCKHPRREEGIWYCEDYE